MMVQFSTFDTNHSHKLKVHKDALNGRVWDSSEPVYWQLDSTYEFLTYDEQVDIVKNAFLELSLTTPLVIRQKRRKGGDAHIRINWLHERDEKYFAKNKNVLAFAYGPQTGIGGDITMNSSKIWRTDKTPLTAFKAKELGFIENFHDPTNIVSSFDPVHTLKHEGGHAFGMKHLENVQFSKTDVMYPYYNGLRMFGDNDHEYIERLYGKIPSWRRAIRIAQRYMNMI